MSRIKYIIIFVLKLTLSISLLYLIISIVGGEVIFKTVRIINPLYFAVASGFYIVVLYLTALRLRLLLTYPLSIKRLFSLSLMSSFFNMYMPSGVGGDVIKIYYLNRKFKEDASGVSLSTIFTSVFMERYLGLGAILFIGMVAFPFGASYIQEYIIWLYFLLFILFILISLLLLNPRLVERIKFLSGVSGYFEFYKNRKVQVAKAFLYSLSIQVVTVILVYTLAKGLKLDIPFLFLLFALSMINIITMLPISFGGVGVREGAFVIFLRAIDISPSVAVSLSIISFLSTAPGNFLGLFEYLRYKSAPARKAEE